MEKHAGTARFVYNWALALLIEDYKNEKKLKPNARDLSKLLTTRKQSDLPWLYETSKWCQQAALFNLEWAYSKFFNGMASFPKFKRKGKKDSFTLRDPINSFSTSVQLPKIGIIKLKEHNYIPVGKLKEATISKYAGKWFVSSWCESDISQTVTTPGTIGIDLGVKALATLSTGETFDRSNKLKAKERKLKRLQRKLARQRKGSKSRDKTKLRYQRQWYKISNHRKDTLHKLTSYLVKTKQEKTLVIEDLNVRGMMQNHCLAKSVGNGCFNEFRRQLEYKCKWYGKELIIVDRFFPSSKLCSNCGNKKTDLALRDRVYNCSNCGFTLDRDLNAAINLSKYTVGNTEIEADGELHSSMKSESNITLERSL